MRLTWLKKLFVDALQGTAPPSCSIPSAHLFRLLLPPPAQHLAVCVCTKVSCPCTTTDKLQLSKLAPENVFCFLYIFKLFFLPLSHSCSLYLLLPLSLDSFVYCVMFTHKLKMHFFPRNYQTLVEQEICKQLHRLQTREEERGIEKRARERQTYKERQR